MEQKFFERMPWAWQNIRHHDAPVVPDLNSDIDTKYFDDIETAEDKVDTFSQPRVCEGRGRGCGLEVW